ncbi:hypothetical protein [Deinococcus sonorensis]|uniref:Uncharacterized protein n=2 Tax=Deinococcus sonorensis TaxID=309891 RepID=A0AAU7UC08_9DEIO
MQWIDLYTATDPHPRRFDRLEAVRSYLKTVERLSEEAIARLLETGSVAPPLARRSYRLERPFLWS